MLHRLRHTVGTHLVSQGKILKAAARFRHRGSSTTLRNYVDALPLDDEDADELDALFNDLTSISVVNTCSALLRRYQGSAFSHEMGPLGILRLRRRRPALTCSSKRKPGIRVSAVATAVMESAR
jgi:hypothetical protein